MQGRTDQEGAMTRRLRQPNRSLAALVDEAGFSKKGLAARVVRCNTAGPSAHLELRRLDNDGWFEVQLSKEQFNELQLTTGDQVYVELRNVRVFPEDYSI